MQIIYTCKYMCIVGENSWTCRPRQDAEELARKSVLLGDNAIAIRAPLYLFTPYCPSDVKRDEHGNIICWEAKR